MYHFELTATEIDWLRKILENQKETDKAIIRDSDDALKTLVERKLMITLAILDKLKNAEHENTH